MSGADGVMVSVPSNGMGRGKPAEKICDMMIRFRSHHEVPVIGHEAIGKYRESKPFVGFEQNLLEGFVVTLFFKKFQTCHGTVENVETDSRRAMASSSGHLN